MTLEAKRTLIYAILKFLKDELKQDSIAPDFKESLEVASQCLESTYEIALDDEICKNNFDSGLDLLALAEKNVIKKELSPEIKERADKHKSEGNELMKQEKYSEALEQYNKAIELDKNNSVYYCNRAAAHSKLADFINSIEDCKNALKIDPSYGKAWGRLGLALLSNNQFEEAYEAYNKAIQLEPTNEGYKQNLKIVEEKLRSNPAASGMPDMNGPFGNMGNLMSMFNNPQLMNMASQLMSDPQMQNVMSNIISSMAGPGGPGAPGGAPAAAAEPTPEMPQIPPFGVPAGGNFDDMIRSAQQWATQMSASNPELIQQLRSRAQNPGNPDEQHPETHPDGSSQ